MIAQLLPKKTCPKAKRRSASSSCTAMNCWLILAIILTLAMVAVAPQQLSNVLNKLLLMSLAGWCGYWLHVSSYKYARPGVLLDLIDHANPDAAQPSEGDLMIAKLAMTSMQCRAVIMSAAMIAIALGM
jgi:hypothetical protein